MNRFVLTFLLSLGVLFGIQSFSHAESEEIVVIVNADNPVTSIKTSELRDYFFKRKRTWPDGTSVRFIDRSTGSAVRQTFLRSYLGKKSDEVDMYWIGQKLYSGDAAPLQESSDGLAIRFVESFKGAIGYVSSSTDFTDRNVKAVKVEP